MKRILICLLGVILAAALVCAAAFQSPSEHLAQVPSPSPAAATPTPTPTPSPPPSPTPTPEPVPAPDYLILVNYLNPIPDDYTAEMAHFKHGHTMATICHQALNDMLTACTQAGNKPSICSGYRSVALQTNLFNDKVNRVRGSVGSAEEAIALAASEVAYPGTSEHHTGLAIDLVDSRNWNLDERQEQMPTQQWLMENSWKYGFVLRYPNDKSHITGIIYEPWHYRYVGTEAAKIMYEEDLCLEEYLEKYYPIEAYVYAPNPTPTP